MRAAAGLVLLAAGVAGASAQGTLTLLPTTVPSASAGVAYNQLIDAAGGNAPYTFSLSSGSLPTGLTIAPNGTLSGTPSGGSYTFELMATDSTTPTGNTGVRTYTMNVGTPGGGAGGGIAIHPGSLPNGSQSVAYSQTISATGGSGGYVYSRTSGTLPTGVTLNTSTGALSGTPSAAGSYAFTLQVRDSDGNTDSQAYTVDIGGNILTLSPTSLPPGQQSTPYSQTVTASNGTGGYTYAVSSGTLPASLSLNGATGAITGTPSGAGTSNFTIRATDSSNNVGSQAYSIYIGSNILTVAPPTLPNGSRTTPYSQTITASGGVGGYSFAVTSGSLPAGLTLAAGGGLTGTPTATGTANFTVQATDSGLNTGSQAYSLTIDPAPILITPSTLPTGTVSAAYAQTLTASNGTGPYSFTILSGTLPPGLGLAATGTTTASISGVPTTPGAYTFTIQATDALAVTGTRTYTVNVGSNILTLSPSTLPNGTQGTAYTTSVSGVGGTAPYTFTLASGTLPTGLTLASNGTISGTPSGSGLSSFTLAARDSFGNTGSQAYSINIGTNSLTVNPPTITPGTLATPYSRALSVQGGTGPFTYALASGALPAGLTLSSAGVISGTPSAPGVSAFSVRAVDSLGNAGSRAYSMSIGTVSLTVNPATLPSAAAGGRYSAQVSGAGGTAPYTFSVSAGALPSGLTINATTGVISGTPRTAGTATFTIQAMDVNGNIGSRAYSLVNRTDPASDPEVQGLIASQVAAARRFASAQMSNVTRHLEGLHGEFNPCSFNFGLAPPMESNAPQPYGAPYGAQTYADPNALYTPYGNYGTPSQSYGAQSYGAQNYAGQDSVTASAKRKAAAYPPAFQQTAQQPPVNGQAGNYQPVYAQAGPVAQRQPGPPVCAADWASSMSFWTAGSFQFGSMTPSGLTSGNRFNTAGITVGVDSKLSEKLIVGAAFGFGADRTDVGANGSRTTATSYSGTLYGSLRPFDPLFLDAAIGYGTLGFDNNRYVTGDGSFATGKRTGSVWFGSLTASFELGRDGIKFAPYIGADIISGTLDAYDEQGGATQALSYDKMKFQSTSASIGLRGSIDIPVSFGTLTPMARIEYRYTAQGSYDQALYYSDLGSGTASTFSQPAGSNGMTTGTLGIRARGQGGLTVELEYALSTGADSLMAHAIRAAMRLPF